MHESEFIRMAEDTLRELERRVEASGIDVDCEVKGTRVLEAGFQDAASALPKRSPI